MSKGRKERERKMDRVSEKKNMQESMKKVDSWNKPPWKRNIRMKGKGVNIINTKRNSTYKPTKKKKEPKQYQKRKI